MDKVSVIYYNKSMHKKIIDFIKYNNAFTIGFVICFFGFGISFAASPQLRDGVYSSEETVVSVDNGLIVSTDFDNFNFNLRINSITEDEKNYFVVYSYQTLAIEDGFWQAKELEKNLTVSKEALEGKDLGLYVAEELGENINYEMSYLKKVQKLEKERGESPKIVAVEYSGLIGKLLNPEEKVIEGYNPVIPEPVPEVPATVESNPAAVILSVPVEEIVDEELVQEVVEELLQEEETLAPESEPAPVVEPAPEPVQEIIPEPILEEIVPEVVPEIIPESEPEPEVVSEPVEEVIPEVVPEVIPETETIPEPEPVPEPTQ